MSRNVSFKWARRGFYAAALASGLGCDSPDIFLPFAEFGGAAGVIDGTVTYSGPLPCTENQRIVGAALLLAFDVRLLPPPEGLGTSAASLGVVPGETLFSGVRDKLTFDPNGKRWCPAMGGEVVTVSGDWAISPLPPSTYQIRGFYDLDGSFDPGFSIANLPTKGDIGGGAIDNAAQVLLGDAPIYREIPLVASEQGTRVAGVAVTLGLPLPLERPIFYSKAVTDAHGKNKDPKNVVMPSDFQLDTFSVAAPDVTEGSFLRLTLGAGLPAEEVEDAKAKPFGLPVPGNFFYFSREDTNRDGKINKFDHSPESVFLPSFMPLSIFSRLSEGSDLVAQSRPAIVIQGLTIWKSMLDMGQQFGIDQTFEPADMEAISTELNVGVRPAALCLHVADPTRPGLLVVTHRTDKSAMMNTILSDEKGVTDALAKQFGRPIEVAYGCLPEGKYAMNLVYETGQAWTVPNEAGVCAPSEPLTMGGAMCGTRRRLASQGVVLTVGPPDDPAYCAKAEGAKKIQEVCSPVPSN